MSKLSISGGELVVLSLLRNGIKKVFGLVGNHVSPIFVFGPPHGLEIIDVRHEQAAVHMADGWSQSTRELGVAIVVGGPGLTNSITGIVKAHMAKTPMLVIVGASAEQNKQIGALQQMDQLSMIRDHTKWCAGISDVRQIPQYIATACEKALLPVTGPTVLEIPINALRAQVTYDEISWSQPSGSGPFIDLPNKTLLADIAETIACSKKPLIIVGDQVYYSRSEGKLLDFVEATGIPAVTINKGRGCIPDSHRLCFGNGRVLEAGPQLHALNNADALINLGSYEDYQMEIGQHVSQHGKSIINIHNSRIETDRPDSTSLVCDFTESLPTLTEELGQLNIATNRFAPWIKELKANEALYWEELSRTERPPSGKLHPAIMIEAIMTVLNEDDIIVLDGSNAMFWGALLFRFNHPGQLIIGPDGTLGAMGCGVPLAIAAKLANPNKNVLLYTGDGSFGFNAMEIDTAVRFNIPIIVAIHNDMSWGFCKSTQAALYGPNNVSGTELGAVRYDKLVQSLGGHGELVQSIEEVVPATKRALAAQVPTCLNFIVDENVFAPGAIAFNKTLVAEKQSCVPCFD